jgi:hypothetical protein
MNIQNMFNTTQLMLNRKSCSPLQNSRSTQSSKQDVVPIPHLQFTLEIQSNNC